MRFASRIRIAAVAIVGLGLVAGGMSLIQAASAVRLEFAPRMLRGEPSRRQGTVTEAMVPTVLSRFLRAAQEGTLRPAAEMATSEEVRLRRTGLSGVGGGAPVSRDEIRLEFAPRMLRGEPSRRQGTVTEAMVPTVLTIFLQAAQEGTLQPAAETTTSASPAGEAEATTSTGPASGETGGMR